MSTSDTRSFVFSTAEDTTRFAKGLAAVLTAGDVILLQGDLGAGKTHFARGLIQARLALAGLAEDVPSPTFTLIQTYSDGTTEIWHSDLYRLTSVDEIYELGLLDAFDTAICLVEWPDRLEDETPATALTLHFAMTRDPGVRQAKAIFTNPRWAEVLDGLDG